MSGNLVSVSPNTMYSMLWLPIERKYKTYIKLPYNVNNNDTYISIFNLQTASYYDRRAIPGQQQEAYELFVKHPNVKIIWESKLAVNRRPGYGTVPRNKVVVWEYVNQPSN
jgi:hypothetical protein